MASGIAASLGLPVDSPVSNVNTELTENVNTTETGPLSDLEHFEDSFVRENHGVKRTRSEDSLGTGSSSALENNSNSSGAVSSPPKKVSKLALEWTEDEEEVP